MIQAQKFLILYASFSGNTQTLAEMMHQELQTAHAQASFELKDIKDLAPADLLAYDFIIFGTSTWDDYPPTPEAQAFLEQLQNHAVDLSTKKIALFGLGDSNYENFCNALNLFQQALVACGAEIVGDLYKIDGFMDENTIVGLMDWIRKILASRFLDRPFATPG